MFMKNIQTVDLINESATNNDEEKQAKLNKKIVKFLDKIVSLFLAEGKNPQLQLIKSELLRLLGYQYHSYYRRL